MLRALNCSRIPLLQILILPLRAIKFFAFHALSQIIMSEIFLPLFIEKQGIFYFLFSAFFLFFCCSSRYQFDVLFYLFSFFFYFLFYFSHSSYIFLDISPLFLALFVDSATRALVDRRYFRDFERLFSLS